MSRGVSNNPRGMLFYARIVATMIEQPRTVPEITEHLGGSLINNVSLLVWRLHAMKLVHVAGWKSPKPRAMPMPVWAFGKGADAPHPPCFDGSPRLLVAGLPTKRLPMRVSAYTFGLLLIALADGHTVKSLCELLGLHRDWLYQVAIEMRRLHLIHIGGWEQQGRGGGPDMPIYKLGDKRDRDRRRLLTDQERGRRYRQRRAERERFHELAVAVGVIRAPEPAMPLAA